MRFSKIFRIRLGSRILASKIQFWNEELHIHYGITNEVPNSKLYIPFWDFQENLSLEKISDGLKRRQDEEFLSDIYILQTYPKLSFRAFCFDEMGFQYFIEILAGTENIDLNYLKHSVMRGRAVIRVSEKDGTRNRVVKIIKTDSPPTINKFHAIHHKAFFSAIYHEIPPPYYIPKPIQVRVSKYESFR